MICEGGPQPEANAGATPGCRIYGFCSKTQIIITQNEHTLIFITLFQTNSMLNFNC